MQVIIRAKNPVTSMTTDIGTYNVLNNKLTLWVNSSRLMNGEKELPLPVFDMPDNVSKLLLEDAATGESITVPLKEFNSCKGDEVYSIPWGDWSKKYKQLF